MAEEETTGLTQGICKAILNGDSSQTGYLQVLTIDANNANRIKIQISDEKDYITVIISSQLSRLFSSEECIEGSVITLEKYNCSTIPGIGRTAILTGISVAQKDCQFLGPDPNREDFGLTLLDQTKLENRPSFGKKQFGTGAKRNSSAFGAGANPSPVPAAKKNTTSFMPIKSLNPYMPRNNWTIKGRVTDKGDIREWNNARGSGKLFSFAMMDEQGTEIRITAFKEECDKWFSMIEEGSIYTLSKARVKTDSYKSRVKNEYAITCTRETEIKLCSDDKSFAKPKYNFTNFEAINALGEAEVGDRNNPTFVDVCCVVKQTQPLHEFTSKQGKELRKRDLHCVDETNFQINVTLWGSYADKYTEEVLVPGSIVILPGCKVSNFGGKSLSANKVVDGEACADYERAQQLKTWWDNNGQSTDFQKATQAVVKRNVTTWREAQEQGIGETGRHDFNKGEYKGEWLTLTGTFTQIFWNLERPPWYKAALDSAKKVTETSEGSGKYVDNTGKEYDDYNLRWILRVRFADFTGSQICTCFQKTAEQVLGFNAKDIEQAFENKDDDAIEKAFKDAQFSSWRANVIAKQESYQDELRMKYTIQTIEPLNYAEDSKRLLQALSEMQ